MFIGVKKWVLAYTAHVENVDFVITSRNYRMYKMGLRFLLGGSEGVTCNVTFGVVGGITILVNFVYIVLWVV